MPALVEMIPDGGVTSAKGYLAGATYAGLKTQEAGVLDLGILLSEVPATLAATFSTNKILSPSVTLSRERARRGTARGVVANSGCANCCVGGQGLTDAKELASDPITPVSICFGIEVRRVRRTAATGRSPKASRAAHFPAPCTYVILPSPNFCVVCLAMGSMPQGEVGSDASVS